MALHDWSRIPAGLFHDFHQTWSIYIKNALNGGVLPKGFAAFVEQKSGPKSSDVLTLESGRRSSSPDKDLGGSVATLAKPATTYIRRTENDFYSRKANRIVIRHQLGRTVAVIEIVSPGNKDSRLAFTEFVEKTVGFLSKGVHVLVVDLFPPTKRDPFGIHKAIWDEVEEEDFVLPDKKNRVLASYVAGEEKFAYVEVIGVGDKLPDMSVFLTEDYHVVVPLEATYAATWEVCPEVLRQAVETGRLPEMEEQE